jgi:parallel beta-helix repeat protein
MTDSHRVTACFGSGLIVVLLAVANPAVAASQRTFVSTAGVDNPACSIGAPCRTFGAALPATLPEGEIIVLTSGGYGAVTITQSVSIIAPPGIYAGISVFSGTGVTVTTAATDVVTLRGLTINNVGSGVVGIGLFGAAGRLQLADVSVTGFTSAGLIFRPSASSQLVVERSNFSGNGQGMSIEGSASITVNAVIDGVRVHHNVLGIFFYNNVRATVRNSVIFAHSNGVGAAPLEAGSNTNVTLESTEISFSGLRGVRVGDPGGTSQMTIIGCTIVNNGTGIFTTNAAETRLAGTTISRNSTGIAYASGGLALSQGNNLIDGNGTDGAAPTIVGAK